MRYHFCETSSCPHMLPENDPLLHLLLVLWGGFLFECHKDMIHEDILDGSTYTMYPKQEITSITQIIRLNHIPPLKPSKCWDKVSFWCQLIDLGNFKKTE